MGLDNIPREYPCKARGVAVFVPELDADGTTKLHADGTTKLVMSCTATKEAGVCPLLNAPDRPENGAVYGMLGTDCWYRGKWGVHLLEHLGVSDYSLYGGDNDALGEEDCELFANTIEDALNEWLTEHDNTFVIDGDELTDDVRYLIWWLRFVAREADGFTTWY